MTTTDTYKRYEGIVEYEGTSNIDAELNYILHPEGRTRVSKVNDELQFTYEYHIKDHLGNTRVAFDAVPVSGGGTLEMEPLAFQYTDYYPSSPLVQIRQKCSDIGTHIEHINVTRKIFRRRRVL